MDKVLVLGLFDNGDSNLPTPLFQKFDSKVNGKLNEHISLVGTLKQNNVRIFYKVIPEYPVVCVVGLGPKDAGINDLEDLDEKKENIRRAIASAISAIRSLDGKFNEIHLDSCDDAESVAIGATVSDWRFDELKDQSLQRKPFKFVLADQSNMVEEFNKGILVGDLQNQCRRIQELPANILTPTKFSEIAKDLCEPLGVKVHVHDRKWAEEKKMGSFLSVANGTDEPCKFVELHYLNAGEKRPFVFVGKGITFDSGGISIKPAAQMDLQRADMGGGATVLYTIASLAKLKSKVNVIGLIPLTENLINGKATKPGDVIKAMNGKSIQINNTDAEGRLVLADALCYADTFNPELVMTIATLTGASRIALGPVAAAAFSNNEKYWNLLRESGRETGERLWRMPMYSEYAKMVKNSHLADLINTQKEESQGAGTITAAMFLKEFSKSKNWMHCDMSCVKYTNSNVSLGKGMTGRPMRTMVNFIRKIFI